MSCGFIDTRNPHQKSVVVTPSTIAVAVPPVKEVSIDTQDKTSPCIERISQNELLAPYRVIDRVFVDGCLWDKHIIVIEMLDPHFKPKTLRVRVSRDAYYHTQVGATGQIHLGWKLASEYCASGDRWSLIGQPLRKWLECRTPFTYRARRLIRSEQTWIRSHADRKPTEADLPILVNNGSTITVYHTIPTAMDLGYLWIPWTPPHYPPKSQTELDNEACKAQYKEWYGDNPSTTVERNRFFSGWAAALAWERQDKRLAPIKR
jgi:hypothetical protein